MAAAVVETSIGQPLALFNSHPFGWGCPIKDLRVAQSQWNNGLVVMAGVFDLREFHQELLNADETGTFKEEPTRIEAMKIFTHQISDKITPEWISCSIFIDTVDSYFVA